MKRLPFLSALAVGVAGMLGLEMTQRNDQHEQVTIRGVRATVHAFKNSKGEVVAALDEHGNLGIRGSFRSVEIEGDIPGGSA